MSGTYCVSDIHGHYDEFMELLTVINFQSGDTLYILGDAIDRGPDSIKTLLYIIDSPNIKMLLGNHEQFMIDAFTNPGLTYEGELVMETWLDYNGGNETWHQYHQLPDSEQNKIKAFLLELPQYEIININSKKFFLVHAGLNCTERKPRERLITMVNRQKQDYPKDMLWVRNEFLYMPALLNYHIIFGHTSTFGIVGHRKDTIWHSNTFKATKLIGARTNIDCGCYKGGNLAALRLDDMKEFYVKSRRYSFF